ncbi:Splicing factor 3B subunit [Sesamum angolense]|uniref:Splicing factor 3B subunit n=1 Tax=Sesamum angolense TaxID=2727404 RepID=A0AAE2BN27_9LAMI|nr:Splicing factor 3B subunit [Sesamum angolense]
MADNSNSTVYIGNLDERVSDRVLYDILIQAGRLVDLYIPRDKETDKPKGYAFAQYESQDIAHYAVNLFSGLVTLYRRTLKFALPLINLCNNQMGIDHIMTTPITITVEEYLGQNWSVSRGRSSKSVRSRMEGTLNPYSYMKAPKPFVSFMHVHITTRARELDQCFGSSSEMLILHTPKDFA